MLDDFEFQFGDICRYAGVIGVVDFVTENTIEAKFENGERLYFKRCGRRYSWEIKPILEFVERPKKMRKVEKTVWINGYNANVIEKMKDDTPHQQYIQIGSTRHWSNPVPMKVEFEVEE